MMHNYILPTRLLSMSLQNYHLSGLISVYGKEIILGFSFIFIVGDSQLTSFPSTVQQGEAHRHLQAC